MSDLISREELLHAIDEKYSFHLLTPSESDIVSWIYEIIQVFPSAVPTPHGRLIDADALIENECFYETEMEVKEAPTVIEAEADHE